jgi:hypothetical protein
LEYHAEEDEPDTGINSIETAKISQTDLFDYQSVAAISIDNK